jgi:hypothetical protein
MAGKLHTFCFLLDRLLIFTRQLFRCSLNLCFFCVINGVGAVAGKFVIFDRLNGSILENQSA